jgi:RNA polymerase sigma-70 factor (sigma-B/F/G subfamily)
MLPTTTSTHPEHGQATPADLSSENIDTLMRDLTTVPPGPRHTALRNRTIHLLLPLAHRLARRYRTRGEDIDDLVQVACLGLIKAVDGYDPTFGNAFLSYALPTIAGEIKRHLRDRTRLVRLPRPVQEAQGRIFQAVEELEQRHGAQSPTPEQIAEHTGLDLHHVISTLRAVRECSPRYLDADTDNGEGCPLISLVGAEDRAMGLAVDTIALATVLKQLSERERRILYLRFYQDQTQQQIAEAMGVSQMQISRILARCFTQLRQALQGCESSTTDEGQGAPSPSTLPARARRSRPAARPIPGSDARPPTRSCPRTNHAPQHGDPSMRTTAAGPRHGNAAGRGSRTGLPGRLSRSRIRLPGGPVPAPCGGVPPPAAPTRRGEAQPSRNRFPATPCAVRPPRVKASDRPGPALDPPAVRRRHRAKGAAGLPRPPPTTSTASTARWRPPAVRPQHGPRSAHHSASTADGPGTRHGSAR